MNLSGKRVLITGASGGLGMACVDALLAAGANVIGIDKKDAGIGCPLVIADLRDESQVVRAVAEAVATLGGLDILINNAAVLHLEDAGAMPGANVLESLDVNLLGAWRVTAAALPALREARGRVVNVASLFAVVNAPFIAGYATSKRALTAYSDVLRFQHGDRISVATVYPGYMDTPIHDEPMRQGLSVARLVTFGLGGRSLLTMEEPLPACARSVLAACVSPVARDRALTLRGALSYMFARHLPRLVDWFIARRLGFLVKRGLRVELEAGSRIEPTAA